MESSCFREKTAQEILKVEMNKELKSFVNDKYRLKRAGNHSGKRCLTTI